MVKLFVIFVLSFQANMKSIEILESDTLDELIGKWELDMTPENKTDNNFSMMEIKSVSNSTFTGTFYRDDVLIREGRINSQTGIVYAALISGDNSGEYNTTFYLKDKKLYGTTHSIKRDFLAVWVAKKINKKAN